MDIFGHQRDGSVHATWKRIPFVPRTRYLHRDSSSSLPGTLYSNLTVNANLPAALPSPSTLVGGSAGKLNSQRSRSFRLRRDTKRSSRTSVRSAPNTPQKEAGRPRRGPAAPPRTWPAAAPTPAAAQAPGEPGLAVAQSGSFRRFLCVAEALQMTHFPLSPVKNRKQTLSPLVSRRGWGRAVGGSGDRLTTARAEKLRARAEEGRVREGCWEL